jgi:formylmethanofuran dehydrogenase subunit A
MTLGILNGRLYDPRNGMDGVVQDIWIRDGRIVDPPEAERKEAEIIDAAGMVVMPGGVDIHSHIVGAKVNAGRKFCPEDHQDHVRSRTGFSRSGVGYTVPTTYLTGYRYAEMGYTTVMEAATAPLVARHTHEELEDTPILDKGIFVTMGNNHFIMQAIRDGAQERARDYVAWLLEATQGYAIKIVNPGGVENWKWGGNVSHLDDPVIGFEVTPRQIIQTLAWINTELGLPHVPHIHGLRLGQSGNAETTIETIRALEGQPAHLCHLQFLSYGGSAGRMRSGAALVADAVNDNLNVTVDVGQVIFGPATTMTSDGPLEFRLHRLTGHKWLNDDVEAEGGGGVVPMDYRAGNVVNGIQWLTGLELFLLIQNPWQVFLTTDHPNGGPFFCYPQVIRLLMDRDYRSEMLGTIHKRAQRATLLPQLDREYSLYEIAIITRAGTAQALGLAHKGHLGIGADGDVTVYQDLTDREAMFAHPRYVIKGGQVVVRDGKLVAERPGRTLVVKPAYDAGIRRAIRAHFEQAYSLSFDNYPVQADTLQHVEVVSCE